MTKTTTKTKTKKTMTEVVYLVRHAAPPGELRGRYWGRADPGLDPASLAAAGTLAELAWKKPVRLFASPLRRAFATAEAVSGPLGLPVETDPALAEVDFGTFDGMDFAEVNRLFPDEADKWAREGDHYAFPDGEAVQDFFHRVTAAWKHYRDLPEPAIMVVTHGGVISAWACLFLGLPLAKRFIFPPAYAALTAFMRRADGSGWNMAFFNNTP